MYLSNVEITNFRIIEALKIKLNKGLNLIVGENNSGKTAFVDAIKYSLDTNSSEWIYVKESDFHLGKSEFSIKLKFEDITPPQASVFVEHLTQEEVGEHTRKSVLYVNFLATLTGEIKRGFPYIKTEIRSGENVDGPKLEREVRDFLSVTFLKPLRDAEAELSSGRGSRLSQILFSTDEFKNGEEHLNEIVKAILEANDKIIANVGVEASRLKIKNYLENLKFTSDSFDPSIEIMGNKKFTELTVPEKNTVFKAILEKLSLSLDKESPFQGLGYNNLLFMATELLLLEQEQEDFPFLIIEEPEAHLHPQLQMKFLNYINSQKTNLQSILTTHSPNLASKASLENVFLFSNGKAFSLRKDETNLENDDYIFLEKFLDVTKSNLFFSKSVLIVEGDGENILLPTIANLLGRTLEDYGASMVNVGNLAFSRYSSIFKRAKLDDVENKDKWIPVKVGCVRDLDLWPEKAEKNDENEPFGFKLKKEPVDGVGGNLRWWESTYNTASRETYVLGKKSLSSQNVKVFVSDKWTFEYSLAINGLAEEVYHAVKGNVDGFTELPTDNEERAISIYKLIDEGNCKTKVAYNLIKILSEKYSGEGQADILKSKLPSYIVEALEYVTKEFEVVESQGEQS